MASLKPRCLVIASFPESLIVFRGALINALSVNGVEVHVAAPGISATPHIREALCSMGVFVHDIPLTRTGTNPMSDARLFVALFFLMRRLRPEISLPYTIKPVVYGTLAAWLARVPRRFALVTGLGYAFTGNRQGMVKSIISMLYRLALGRANKVFFQNQDDELDFRQLGILPSRVASVVVNGSGVDLDSYPFQPATEGPLMFLMIGRLLGDKGVREYAEAARQIMGIFPSIRFQLAGWIDANPDAISQSELDGWIADGYIDFLGKLDDVRPAIAAASVYVLPSYREGTPRTVLEAMAMGRPIITTDAPGCRETVVDGDNGYMVAARSVMPLKEAMERFIRNPGLVGSMGRRSREIAEEKYDVKKVNAVMLREMGIARRCGDDAWCKKDRPAQP